MLIRQADGEIKVKIDGETSDLIDENVRFIENVAIIYGNNYGSLPQSTKL